MSLKPFAIVFVAALVGPVGATPQDAIAPVLEKFLSSGDVALASYEATRTLDATTRGGRITAAMTVLTTLGSDGAFSYRILAETGSGTIRQKVFVAALEAERVALQEPSRGALSPQNYSFAMTDETADGLMSVAIRPHRPDKYLIQGRMLLTPDEADLVRVEGLLAKRPSFWTRRVEVTRRYGRVAGVRVPLEMQSVADVLVAGRSTFTMRYAYTSVNGQPAPSMASN